MDIELSPPVTNDLSNDLGPADPGLRNTALKPEFGLCN